MRNNVEKIAVIDIGSNSVRLFVFGIEGRDSTQIEAKKFFCGLGQDLGTTGRLNPEAVAFTHKQLKLFKTELQNHDITKNYVIGTAALREASDAEAFVQDVRRETGFEIKIIDGEEEARLAALAILHHNPDADGVVADFGGGSLELARIAKGVAGEKLSLRLGAHYLKALEGRETEVGQRLDQGLGGHIEFLKPQTLYIIGGSWRSLVKAWLMDKHSNAEIDGFAFKGADIAPFCQSLQKTEPKELVSRYQMEEPRARLMDVSSLMLQKLIDRLNPLKVEVSAAGIRDGIVFDHILNAQE